MRAVEQPEHLVVPRHLARPQPVLQDDAAVAAEEDELVELKMRHEVRVGVDQMREPAQFLVHEDREDQRQEIADVALADAEDDCGRQQNQEVAIRREVHALQNQHGAECSDKRDHDRENAVAGPDRIGSGQERRDVDGTVGMMGFGRHQRIVLHRRVLPLRCPVVQPRLRSVRTSV